MSKLPTISRVNRSRAEAKNTYNRYGLIYDYIGGQFERSYAMAGIELLHIQPGERVLEIGFGTGHGILELAKKVGPQGGVVGIDIAERMCAVTRRRISRTSLNDRVILYCCDALPLPLLDRQFDAVFMSFTLELFDTPDIPRLLGECKRVLKSGGRISIVSLVKPEEPSSIVRMYEWIHRRFPQWVDCRPIYAKRALMAAGFKIKLSQVRPMFGLAVALVLAI